MAEKNRSMLDVSEALEKILLDCRPVTCVETLPIEAALNRVLGEDLVSTIDVPPRDNSAMDGYAVNTDDLLSSTSLTISQRITAGTAPAPFQRGTAARIFTGGEIPEGADAVVMQENCEAANNTVTILKTPNTRENIRPQGQDIQCCARVLERGTRLKPQHLGLIASVGVDRVKVFSQPHVTVFSTGNELLEPGQASEPGKIFNSNRPMLVAMLSALGCRVSTFKNVTDTFEQTREALQTCAERSNLVITTGGVSVGEEDHVKAAVNALGEIAMWKVKMKPGKPIAFGKIRHCHFIGLPGNPVSAFVTTVLLGLPFIRKLQGERKAETAKFFLPANFSITESRKRPEYARAQIGNGKVSLFPNQSSGVLGSVCWANALALIPADTIITPGDAVEVYPLASLLS